MACASREEAAPTSSGGSATSWEGTGGTHTHSAERGLLQWKGLPWRLYLLGMRRQWHVCIARDAEQGGGCLWTTGTT